MGATRGLQQMSGWPGDACPRVPAASQPPAAAEQLPLRLDLPPPPKKKKTTLGATSGLCSPCGPPLSPSPWLSPVVLGEDVFSPNPGWAPWGWFLLSEQTKRSWKRLGHNRERARLQPGQALGHVGDGGQDTVAGNQGTGAWPGMGTSSLRMGTRDAVAKDGEREWGRRHGWGQGSGCG